MKNIDLKIAKQKQFSVLKILASVYIEKIHRQVFDNQFQQDYTITWKDYFILKYYAFLFWLIPDFRSYLKYWKPILKRAYTIKRLSAFRQIAFRNIYKLPVGRYSAYSFE